MRRREFLAFRGAAAYCPQELNSGLLATVSRVVSRRERIAGKQEKVWLGPHRAGFSLRNTQDGTGRETQTFVASEGRGS